MGKIEASRRVLYAISLNHFTNDGSAVLISTLFPVLISGFGISTFYIGILVAVGYTVTMVFQPITGHYAEKFGSRILLALGISLIGLSMVFFSFSSAFISILISVVILRFGSSFFHPVGVSLISSVYEGERLDRYMGIQSSFGNLGIFAVFAVSAPLYLYFGWKAPFLTFLMVDIAAVITTLTLIRNKSLERTEHVEETKPTGRRYPLGLPVFFIVSMLMVGGTYAIFVNFGNILLSHHNYGLVLSDEMISIWLASAFFGAILTGSLTRRFGRFRLLILSFTISGITSLIFALFPGILAVVALTLMVNGLFNSTIYPALYSELAFFIRDKTEGKGTSFGVLFSGQIIGSAVLGFLGGYVASYLGTDPLFIIAAIILFCGVPVTMSWELRFKERASSGSSSKSLEN